VAKKVTQLEEARKAVRRERRRSIITLGTIHPDQEAGMAKICQTLLADMQANGVGDTGPVRVTYPDAGGRIREVVFIYES